MFFFFSKPNQSINPLLISSFFTADSERRIGHLWKSRNVELHGLQWDGQQRGPPALPGLWTHFVCLLSGVPHRLLSSGALLQCPAGGGQSFQQGHNDHAWRLLVNIAIAGLVLNLVAPVELLGPSFTRWPMWEYNNELYITLLILFNISSLVIMYSTALLSPGLLHRAGSPAHLHV